MIHQVCAAWWCLMPVQYVPFAERDVKQNHSAHSSMPLNYTNWNPYIPLGERDVLCISRSVMHANFTQAGCLRHKQAGSLHHKECITRSVMPTLVNTNSTASFTFTQNLFEHFR